MSPAGLDVSRETSERLEHLVALVEKWTPRINLVSRSSLPEIWDRHIRDSMQLFDLVPPTRSWLDLGSGGGFPGIVVAILAKSDRRDQRTTLVESDRRKATFLRTAIRELDLDAQVIVDRIERLEPQSAPVLSARALADLTTLLGFANRHLAPGGIALFPKGATWENEHDAAREHWRFDATPIKSKTEPDAVVLKIERIVRA